MLGGSLDLLEGGLLLLELALYLLTRALLLAKLLLHRSERGDLIRQVNPASRPPWLFPRPRPAKTVPPQGWRDPAGAELEPQ
jgi:hypothetical protein